MRIGREITFNHREAGFLMIHVERIPENQNVDGLLLRATPDVARDKFHELRKANGFIEMQAGRGGFFVVAGEELLELADGPGELVRARLAAVESAHLRDLELR